jgi:DNA processing protein
VVVVSGLARGIDAAAHRGALEAGGRSIAVQACGPDRVYPSEHGALADRIARQGAVVTEFAPATAPLAHHFPLRNRLISGLSSALLVVEARERSGSLVTAGHAANQGVDVFAVPGAIDAPTSRGTNRLLRDGASVALEPRDLLDELRRGGVWRPTPPAAPQRRGRPRPASTRAAPARPGQDEDSGDRCSSPDRARTRAILAALSDSPATRDELIRRLGRAPAQLALELLELELEGRVAEDRDGRLRVVSPRKGPEL